MSLYSVLDQAYHELSALFITEKKIKVREEWGGRLEHTFSFPSVVLFFSLCDSYSRARVLIWGPRSVPAG